MNENRKQEIENYFNSEEFKKDIEKEIVLKQEKEKRKKLFFESDKFFEVYNKIVDSNLEDINDSFSFNYECITEKEFYDFFDSIKSVMSMKEDEKELFFTEFVEYRGLILKLIYGQGTISKIEITSKAKAFRVKKNIENF